MKTSEIFLLGIAGFLGYKMLSGKKEDTGGGAWPGGLNLTMPGINLPGGEGLNLSLGGLLGGGESGNGGGTFFDAFMTKAKETIEGLTEENESLLDLLTGQAKTVFDLTGKVSDLEKTVSDLTKKIPLGEANAIDYNRVIEELTKYFNFDNFRPSEDGKTESPDGKSPDNVIDETQPLNMLENARTTLKEAGRIGLENYIGAFLTGQHIVRPLPFAKPVQEFGKPIVEKVGEKIGEKLAGKLGTKIGAKVGSKFIPFVGWATLLIDPFADIARVFGMDVTEWLGFSPLFSFGKDTNVLEQWVKREEGKWAEMHIVNVAERNNIALSEMPVPYQLNVKEAKTGSPESPALGLKETPVTWERNKVWISQTAAVGY